MKKVFTLLIASLCYLTMNAQTLGRVTFSSGGSSSYGMPVSIGEPFGSSNTNLRVGSQQNAKVDTTIVDTIIGITPISTEKNKVVIFPNPTEKNISVQVIGHLANDFSVQVVDMQGKRLVTQNHNSHQASISLADFPSGSYQVLINNPFGQNIFSQIIIKQ